MFASEQTRHVHAPARCFFELEHCVCSAAFVALPLASCHLRIQTRAAHQQPVALSITVDDTAAYRQRRYGGHWASICNSTRATSSQQHRQRRTHRQQTAPSSSLPQDAISAYRQDKKITLCHRTFCLYVWSDDDELSSGVCRLAENEGGRSFLAGL